MAAALERDLGVPLTSPHGSDVAHEVHVRRVFLRTGLAERDDVEHMVPVARQLNPGRPGELDNPAWDIGRRWCHRQAPDCSLCPVAVACARRIESAAASAASDGAVGNRSQERVGEYVRVGPWQHPNHRRLDELPPALRRAPVPEAAQWWIRRRTASPVASVRRLPGASSTAVHAVRLADGRSLVLRRYVWDEFRTGEPDAPAREVEALDHARRHGLPAPVVVAADPDGTDVGDGIPALLMARLPGRAQAAPDVRVLAVLAAEVHDVSRVGFDHRYFPWCRDTSTRPPASCRRPELWKLALELWRSAEPPYEACFIHRDFHPGNVLWFRGALTGVVDWANACIGPVGIDIATCRWNLQEWAGAEAATAFVTAYEQITRRRHHPYWDVAKIVEDDWDRIDDPRYVWAAEELLAQALPRLVDVAER